MPRLLVLAALLFALPAHAFTITQITDNEAYDGYPDISGSNVVWTGCGGGTGDLCDGGN